VSLAYQSKVGKQKWLEPSLGKILEKFSWKKVIIYPISFIIENSETVYELDIEYKDLAKKFWIKDYLRVECLNEKISDIIISEIKENI
jgi:ferrochelatase